MSFILAQLGNYFNGCQSWCLDECLVNIWKVIKGLSTSPTLLIVKDHSKKWRRSNFVTVKENWTLRRIWKRMNAIEKKKIMLKNARWHSWYVPDSFSQIVEQTHKWVQPCVMCVSDNVCYLLALDFREARNSVLHSYLSNTRAKCVILLYSPLPCQKVWFDGEHTYKAKRQ